MNPVSKLIALTISQSMIALIIFGIWFFLISWSAIQPIDNSTEYGKKLPDTWEYFTVSHGEFAESKGPTIAERPFLFSLLIIVIAASAVFLIFSAKWSTHLQLEINERHKKPNIIDFVFKYLSLAIVTIATLGLLFLTIINLV